MDAATRTPEAALLAALAAAPRPALDGEANVAWLETFVATHKPRITGTPQEKAAGDDLSDQLLALGYQVQNRYYTANGEAIVEGPLRVVLGIKEGTAQPDRLVILGAHYDTSATIGNADLPILPFGTGVTIEAAYDNGSGTALVMELARLLAEVPTEKTIVFAFFNGEEEGLLASSAYARELQDAAAVVDAYMGFDMVGINWPSEAGCLCIYAGELYAPELNPLQETAVFGHLGYPRGDDAVQVLDNHETRNSDEASFQAIGYPTMRWAGMAAASDYWAYHKLNDTVPTMEAQAGGADVLAAGFESAAESAYYVALALDRSVVEMAREG